jgi:VWFA-related protein
VTRHMCVVLAWVAGATILPGRLAPGQDQRAVFSSKVEAVRVDALITDKGKTVRDLTAADFDVSDNGVPQQVDLISFDQIPLNVVMALDVSSSLTVDRLAQLRTAGGMLIGSLKPNDQAALITFTEAVTQGTGLTADLRRLHAALEATEAPRGTRSTALIDAVFSALLVAESDVGRSLVVVFSDGVDTMSWLRSDEVIEVAKRSDAIVYAVATRHGGRSDVLVDATDATGGSLFEVESTKDLGATFVAVLNEFRQRYLLSYTPYGVEKGGWHSVAVRVKGRDVKVKARPGYWADK